MVDHDRPRARCLGPTPTRSHDQPASEDGRAVERRSREESEEWGAIWGSGRSGENEKSKEINLLVRTQVAADAEDGQQVGKVENAIDDQLNLPYVDIFLRHSPKREIKEKDIITFSHNSHRKAISLGTFLKVLQHQKIFYTSAVGDFQDKLQACTKATQNTQISPTSSTFHPIPKPVDNVHTTQGGKSRK